MEGQREAEELSVSTNLVRFGPYQVDRRAGEVRKHNQRIRLSGQPFEVLSLLLERPGEVVTREEIRQQLWTENIFVDFEQSLNSAVKKLRRALNDDPQSPRYIEPLPKKGYRFIGTIEPPTAMEHAAGDEPGKLASSFLTLDLPSGPLVPADDDSLPLPNEPASNRRRWMLAIGVAARDQHKILRWLHIQLGTLLVADHHRFFAAAFAHALIRRARQKPAPREEDSKGIPNGPDACRMSWSLMHSRILALRLLDHFTNHGLKLEQFHLRVGELFAGRSILLDPHTAAGSSVVR